MYDESIEVCDDDEDEYELLAGRRRPGVSPVRRGPFQQQQQRPSRSFARTRQFQDSDSLEMSEEEAGSPPAPSSKEEQSQSRKKSLSSKDFTQSPQLSQDSTGSAAGGNPGNLINLASSYAKKLMSGSDKSKEKLPPDVAEGARRDPKGEPKKQHPTQQEQAPRPPSKGKSPQQGQPSPANQSQQQQQSRSTEEDDDDEDEDDDEYDDMNMAQIEGLLNGVANPPASMIGRYLPRPTPTSPSPSRNMHRPKTAPRFQHGYYDSGAAGEPYSSRPPPPPPTSMRTPSPRPPSQFRPGFGPASSNLMNDLGTFAVDRMNQTSDEDDSDAEVSISENEMEDFMDMYADNARGDGRQPGSMILRPSPEMSNLALVDDEVMESMLVHRRMWEYQLDLKREQLRRRTLIMSDFPGVHAADHEVYNPHDYDHLNVSPDVKELFHYITRYEPPMIGTQMDVKLRPFIPEYYPSVGDIDAFIKVIHPEVPDDSLGIKHLDEPSPFQSDPSVLDLRLRALAKQSSSKSVVVKKIDNVGKNSKVIENWIKDISDLHRSKPSPSVHYSKPMPDIDSLIQEWPPQLEDLLKHISLPSSELDCDLATYVDIVCNLLDIPVYKSRIQSLHVLFTMYATYKHFNHYGPLGLGSGGVTGEGNDLDNLLPTGTSIRLDDSEVDRLQIN